MHGNLSETAKAHPGGGRHRWMVRAGLLAALGRSAGAPGERLVFRDGVYVRGMAAGS